MLKALTMLTVTFFLPVEIWDVMFSYLGCFSAFLQCSSGINAPAIIFVSKMFAVDTKALPQKRQR